MQTKDLPDLDKMTPAEIESAAQIARLDRMALDRIQSILTQASMEDRLAIAAIALFYLLELGATKFAVDTGNPVLVEASRYLRRISDDEERLALAIAILEGVQSEREGDAIVPPDEKDEELKELPEPDTWLPAEEGHIYFEDLEADVIVPPDCEFSGTDVALTEDITLRGLQQLR